MSGEGMTLTETEVLAIAIYGAGLGLGDDQAAEEFFHQPSDQRAFWTRAAAAAMRWSDERLAKIPLDLTAEQMGQILLEQQQMIEAPLHEYIGRLERAIVTQALRLSGEITTPPMPAPPPPAVRVPHKGKVT